MNKKRFFASCTFLMVGAIALGVSIVTPLEENSVANANNDYTIVLDKDFKIDSLVQNSNRGTFEVKTSLKNKLRFYYDCGIKNENGFISLGKDGLIQNNEYVIDSALSGLASISVSFTGVDSLTVHYGWGEASPDLLFSSYKTITPLNSTFDFNNEFPSYFKILNNNKSNADIESITLTYTCKKTSAPIIDNDLTYECYSNCCSVASCKKDVTDVIIPDYYNGVPVTEISSNAFADCTSLKSVILSKHIQNIGYGAFSGCASLANIELHNNIYFLRDFAFSGCKSLTSIKIPSGVHYFGSGIFSGCTGLKNVELPVGLTSIPDYMFQNCTSLPSVSIPSSVEKIGNGAFNGCTSFKTFSLANNIQAIGNSCFQNCENLQSITLSNNLKEIPSYCFNNCKSLSSIELPNSISHIGDSAFSYCLNLKTIQLPESTISIGSCGFKSCSSLEKVNLSSKLEEISDSAFMYCDLLREINLSNCIKRIGERAFYQCSSLKQVFIPNSVTYIGQYAFSNISYDFLILSNIEDTPTNWDPNWCDSNYQTIWGYEKTFADNLFDYYICNNKQEKFAIVKKYKGNLSHVSVPNTITVDGMECPIRIIGRSSFEENVNLESVSLPSSIKSIDKYAFQGCKKLSQINLPSNLGSIGSFAFNETKLKEITIPSSVTTIDYYAFANCDSSMVIYIMAESKPQGWDDNWANEIYTLSWGYVGEQTSSDNIEYILSETNNEYVASIKKYNGNSKNLVIPETINQNGKTYKVKGILNNAFMNCVSLETIDMPNGITHIDKNAFDGCKNIKYLILPNTLTSIGDNAFCDMSNLGFIYIPKQVTSIGWCIINISSASINVAAETKPAGWHDSWVSFEDNINWGCINFGTAEDYFNYSIATVNNEKCAIILYYSGRQPEVSVPEFINYGNTKYPVRVIAHSAFFNNTDIVSIKLPNGLKSIKRDAFRYLDCLTTINIPSTVEFIGENAFMGCFRLKATTIPASVEIMQSQAFRGVDILNVEFDAKPADWAVDWCDSDAIVYWGCIDSNSTPDGIKYSICKVNNENCVIINEYKGTGTDVVIPETISYNGVSYPVRIIQQNAFKNMDKIVSIKISENVKEIGTYCFDGCLSLESLYLPASLETIDEYLFGLYAFSGNLYYAGDQNSLKNVIRKDADIFNRAQIYYNYQY